MRFKWDVDVGSNNFSKPTFVASIVVVLQKEKNGRLTDHCLNILGLQNCGSSLISQYNNFSLTIFYIYIMNIYYITFLSVPHHLL